MAEHPPPAEPTRPAMPRWVKVLGLVAIALLLLFLASSFLGGGHGPARHSPTPHGAVDGAAPPMARSWTSSWPDFEKLA